MRIFRRNRKLVVTILSLVIVASPFVSRYIYKNRLAIINNPNASHFIPLYRSLRKLPDIFFLPMTLSTKSKLETMELTIKSSDIQAMNRALPQDPFGDAFLNEENKKWVSADFSAQGYVGTVKVRYRGNISNHWNSYQKSYLIKFDKDNLFRGMRELTLIIPSDRNYFTESLNNFRARKLGFTVPDDSFVKLKLNGADHGVYIAFEHWSQEWLEKAGIEPSSILLGTPDDTNLSAVPLFSEEGSYHWMSWNVTQPPAAFEPVKALVEIINHADVETFRKIIPQIIDMDLFYAIDTLYILSGGMHISNTAYGNNAIFYFDTIEGRLKPIPYNIALQVSDKDIFQNTPTDLQRRILEIPEFKQARDNVFFSYVEENKEEDLSFLENWSQKMNAEFYKDSAKIDNNFTYRTKINYFKEFVAKYFNDPNNIINDLEPYGGFKKDVRSLNFADSFVYLPKTIISPYQFVNEHPEFMLRNNDIILPRGSYFFSQDIIIPVDTKLIISPGTRLFMGAGTSLISYSPIEARGTIDNPISIIPADKNKPWGVFAVINTEDKESDFDYIELSGGKDDTINGVYFAGMLAMHNADGEIIRSRFDNAHADDAINIKKGKVIIKENEFNANSADALDVDFAKAETRITGNRFYTSGGDAIDLSWSDITIENNIISGCIDKGISVGEKSHTLIQKNIIAKCGIGIASKDSSRAVANNNTLIGNKTAISAYRKKPIYEGGFIEVRDSVFWNNDRDTHADNLSIIELIGISKEKPSLNTLPSSIRNKILQ